jgi:4-oxalocrotonate tautomerase
MPKVGAASPPLVDASTPRETQAGETTALTWTAAGREGGRRVEGPMPNVTIEWLEGRTLDQKRNVIAGITDLLVDAANARREAVQVTFINMSKEDWGRGGLLGIDRTDVHP